MSLQTLEERAVMDGDVSAFISSGTLNIVGDLDNNHLIITADPNDPGHVTLSAGDGNTTINGFLGDVEFTFTSDLRISLSGGDDILEIVGDGGPGSIVPRDLLVDLGDAAGQNQFSLTGGYVIGRNLRVTAKTGEDLVDLQDFSAYDAYFGLGTDGGNIELLNATLTRGVSAVYGGSGANINGLYAENLTTGLGVTIQAGTGENDVEIVGSSIGATAFIRLAGTTNSIDLGDAILGPVDIGGNLFIMNTSGTNTVELDNANVIGSTSIRNGNGDNTTTTLDSSFANSFTVVSGAGNNANVLEGVTIDRAASLSGGSGANSLSVENTSFNSTLLVTHGAGDNSVLMGLVDLVNIVGNTTIRQGNATSLNLVTAVNVASQNSFNIQNGNGGATVLIGGPGDGPFFTAAGTLSIKNGNAIGSGNLVAIDNADIGVDIVAVNGNTDGTNDILIGVDAPVTVGRDVYARHGDGGVSMSMLNAVTVTRNLLITARTGDDSVVLESIGTGDLFVGGSTTIDLLHGNDTLIVGENVGGSATFGGYFTARMGNDDDTVTIGEFASFLGFGDYVFFFDGGFGTDVITVTNGTSFDPFDPVNATKIRNFELVAT